MALVCAVVGQVLLTLPLEGPPVRFGVALPAAAVARGLRASGDVQLQWRRLPIGSADADPVWVELALVGRGRTRITAGGAGPCASGSGEVCAHERCERDTPVGRETTTRWRWCTGAVDERRRVLFAQAVDHAGERYAAGEAVSTTNHDVVARAAPLCGLPRSALARIGALPAAGRLAAPVRQQLLAALPALRELPGARGAGDYSRSEGVVTNLEFDTTLALLRCALATGDVATLARAERSARHLVDRDLDRRSGLPFAHGSEHRSGAPEPGHAWLQGLLWAGCLFADDDLLHAARALGRAIAAMPPSGQGRDELARDHAWPLLELEALLAVDPDPTLAAAADRLAAAIAARFDATLCTFRFGEGELGRGLYLERAWLTGGIVLPALRAHLQRRPDRALQERVAEVQAALLRRVLATPAGLPLHWRCAGGEAFGVHAARGDPRGALLLCGFEAADLARLLRRDAVQRHLADTVRVDDPDLATAWTLVARCAWVWR